MPELATTSSARPRRSSNGKVLVSGSKLAVHLGCARQHVEQLAAQGVIERQADGKFDQDQSRLKYLTHLRAENRRSPRTEASAEYVRQKSRLIEIKIAEKEGTLMLAGEHEAFVERLIGLLLTKLGSLPARVAGHDLAQRRKVEDIIFEWRTEFADTCQRMADENGEPPD